jgi:hypothetical protein
MDSVHCGSLYSLNTGRRLSDLRSRFNINERVSVIKSWPLIPPRTAMIDWDGPAARHGWPVELARTTACARHGAWFDDSCTKMKRGLMASLPKAPQHLSAVVQGEQLRPLFFKLSRWCAAPS